MNRIPFTSQPRTRMQWFNSLPEDIRQKAIANYQATGRDNFDHPFKTLDECLTGSFIFRISPELSHFWNEVVSNYEPKKGG